MTIDTQDVSVKRYLHELDRAARWLPRRQADELHEQIASHLHELLPTDADQPKVSKALADLGQPLALVRDAAGSRRRLSVRLRRVRWWTWSVSAVVLAALITSVTVAVVSRVREDTAADLSCSCGIAFVTHTDADSARNIDAGTVEAQEVALRSNHQGFEFDLTNRSHIAQTVLGLAFRPLAGSRHSYTLRLGTRNEHGFPLTDSIFTTKPTTIRPGQNKEAIITWHHLMCSAPRVEGIITDIYLHVRIGSITRTEDIPLGENLIFKVPNPSTTTPATRCVPTTPAHYSR